MRPQRLAVGVAEPCELRQRALPVRSEGLEAVNAGALGQRGEHGSLARRHDGEARTRVAQQVVELVRSEEHTSELQSHSDLVCRLLLEKKKQDRPPQRSAQL